MKRALQLLTGLITGGFLATSTLAQAIYSTPYTFTTIAGTAGNTGGNDGTNGGAQFFSPETVDGLQKTIWGGEKPKKTIETLIYEFALYDSPCAGS